MKLKDECTQMYEGRNVNCVVTKIDETTFSATILGLDIEMCNIPKSKFNPKYCMPDEINSEEEHKDYLKAICYEKYRKMEEFEKENPNQLTTSQQNFLPEFLDLVSKNDMVFSHIEDFSDDAEDVDGILEKLSENYNELMIFKQSNVGLYAFDKDLDSIFEHVPDEIECKTIVEKYLVEQINYLKSIVFKIS